MQLCIDNKIRIHHLIWNGNLNTFLRFHGHLLTHHWSQVHFDIETTNTLTNWLTVIDKLSAIAVG